MVIGKRCVHGHTYLHQKPLGLTLIPAVDKPLEVASVFIQRRPKAILFTTLNQPIEVEPSNNYYHYAKSLIIGHSVQSN